MSAPSHEIRRDLDAGAARETASPPLEGSHARSIFATFPSLASIPVTRGPWFFPAMTMIVTAIFTLLVGGSLIASRQGSPSMASRPATRFGDSEFGWLHDLGCGPSHAVGPFR